MLPDSGALSGLGLARHGATHGPRSPNDKPVLFRHTELEGWRRNVPVIARFYGILIKMYFREHGVA